MTSCSDRDAELVDAAYDPTANGLNTYALACQLAREGHEGLREWFSEQGRPGSTAVEAQYPADLGRRGVAPVRVTTKPAQSDDYGEFLAGKAPRAQAVGLASVPDISPHLMPFQADVAAFALRVGRCGVFLGTGLGKTRVQLEFCRHAAEATNGRALILTPLAVARQIEREAVACGYDARVIREHAEVRDGISICNYDRLDKIDPDAFGAVSLDEASAIKAFGGKTTVSLTTAFASHRFRMAATATPAPNDYMELGTQSQFLGALEYREMLSRWFINDTSTASQKWRIKGHAVSAFWDWVASWARMASLPSDLGYPDDGYILPPLKVIRHRVTAPMVRARPGELFASPASATTMFASKKQTVGVRADAVAGLVLDDPDEPWVVWCDTNDESAALVARIHGAVEVRGNMRTEDKEAAVAAFCDGGARVLVTKPSICGWGLNLQHCARTAFVGRTFSFEAWHQAVRRFHRFGQKREVRVHLVVDDSEQQADAVVARKEAAHRLMQAEMAAAMRRNSGLGAARLAMYSPSIQTEFPSWLSA